MKTLDMGDSPQADYASCRSNISSETFSIKENILISSSITPKIPKRLFNLIKKLGRERNLHKDEVLYAKDSCVHKLAVVLDGTIGKALVNPQGANTEAYAIATPFCLTAGYLNFFSGRPCGQTYFAMTPARIIECDAEALKAEIMKDPELFFETAAHFEMCAASDDRALSARIWPDSEKS